LHRWLVGDDGLEEGGRAVACAGLWRPPATARFLDVQRPRRLAPPRSLNTEEHPPARTRPVPVRYARAGVTDCYAEKRRSPVLAPVGYARAGIPRCSKTAAARSVAVFKHRESRCRRRRSGTRGRASQTATPRNVGRRCWREAPSPALVWYARAGVPRCSKTATPRAAAVF